MRQSRPTGYRSALRRPRVSLPTRRWPRLLMRCKLMAASDGIAVGPYDRRDGEHVQALLRLLSQDAVVTCEDAPTYVAGLDEMEHSAVGPGASERTPRTLRRARSCGVPQRIRRPDELRFDHRPVRWSSDIGAAAS
jgi:hypothetical protein